ncbi:MAG: DNA recombination protein RmuC [Proteobacteria bacterium]|nr:DNA recombination protein RmuC [Pseudomonadota bacterium]
MIQIGGQTYSLDDPLVIGGMIGFAVVIVLLVMIVRSARKSSASMEYMAGQMNRLNSDVQTLGAGQQQLTGNLQSVSDTQANAQVNLIQTMEKRLATVQQHMNDTLHVNALKSSEALHEMQKGMKDSLHGSSVKTTQSLTQLQERLATIDKAQTNIEKLSSDVLGLQDILSNKQTRGAFGEIQLNDIVTKALAPNAYSFQATLSNGKRPDCLIHLPNPPGPIVIDAKFPLEAYEAIRAAKTDEQAKLAERNMRTSLRIHIKAISQKYIIEGETADGALMFLPSEAVYAELHAHFADIVREGFDARVWIVSPTTCMATLNTMRAVLKDARMQEQAGAIRKELGLLYKDVDRLGNRVENLDRHFNQAGKDIEEIKISATKAGSRARRLDAFDFEELDGSGADVVKLTHKPK